MYPVGPQEPSLGVYHDVAGVVGKGHGEPVAEPEARGLGTDGGQEAPTACPSRQTLLWNYQRSPPTAQDEAERDPNVPF